MGGLLKGLRLGRTIVWRETAPAVLARHVPESIAEPLSPHGEVIKNFGSAVVNVSGPRNEIGDSQAWDSSGMTAATVLFA